jgi:hypothetical protein
LKEPYKEPHLKEPYKELHLKELYKELHLKEPYKELHLKKIIKRPIGADTQLISELALDNDIFINRNFTKIEQEYCEKFNVIIECNDEYQQEIIYKKMQAEGYICQVQSL